MRVANAVVEEEVPYIYAFFPSLPNAPQVLEEDLVVVRVHATESHASQNFISSPHHSLSYTHARSLLQYLICVH